MRWNGELQNVSIQLRNVEEGWAVILATIPPEVEEEEDEEGIIPDRPDPIETVAWRAPHSGNMPLPPSRGWIAVDPLANGDIRLKYVLREGKVEIR